MEKGAEKDDAGGRALPRGGRNEPVDINEKVQTRRLMQLRGVKPFFKTIPPPCHLIGDENDAIRKRRKEFGEGQGGAVPPAF